MSFQCVLCSILCGKSYEFSSFISRHCVDTSIDLAVDLFEKLFVMDY